MAIACITCGRSMPDNSEFCPFCGRAVQRVSELESSAKPVAPVAPTPPQAAAPKAQPQPVNAADEPEERNAPPIAWNDRLVAAASYFTIVPAVTFLFVPPYARRQFVRFHSLQSICFWLLALVLLGIGILASTFGFLLIWLFTGALMVLALSLTWLVLSIKALQGEWFEVPGLGYFAGQVRR